MDEQVREHDILGHDGWPLNVVEIVPHGEVYAVVIAGHAMMVDRRTLWRPGRRTLVQTLVNRGIRVLVPDLRGRGKSGRAPKDGGDWGYDDHVADIDAFILFARSLAPDRPLFLLGHSLFAHAGLAYLGTHPQAPIAGHIAIAANIWNRRFVESTLDWWRMRLAFARLLWATRLYGYAPVLRFRFGSADEAKAFIGDVHRWVASNRWTSSKGVDYFEREAQIQCPVLHVVSDGDELYAAPNQSLRFTSPVPQREVMHLGPSGNRLDLSSTRPGHMALVTDPRSQPIWSAIAEWIVAKASKPGLESQERKNDVSSSLQPDPD